MFPKYIEEGQDMLRVVINNIPQHIFWSDVNSIFVGCNMNFAKIMGLEKPENVIGKTYYDIIDKPHADLFMESDKEATKENKTIYGKIQTISTISGKKIIIRLNKAPIHNKDSSVIGVVGVVGTFEDITLQTEMENKLAKSEEKYRNLIESTNTGYIIMDMDLNILESNQNFFNMMRAKANKDIIGKNPRAWVTKQYIDGLDRGFKDLLNGRSIEDIEIGMFNCNGEIIFVNISANIIENGSRKIFCLIRDISDKKRINDKQYIEDQKQRDKIKQNIMDIRGQLNKIRMLP